MFIHSTNLKMEWRAWSWDWWLFQASSLLASRIQQDRMPAAKLVHHVPRASTIT